MTITCFIRYQIDPFQSAAFHQYADAWAAYERYRAALKHDDEGRASFAMAQSMRFILREERTWLQGMASTLNKPREVTP